MYSKINESGANICDVLSTNQEKNTGYKIYKINKLNTLTLDSSTVQNNFFKNPYETLFYNVICDFMTCVFGGIYEYKTNFYYARKYFVSCLIHDRLEMWLMIHTAVNIIQNVHICRK